ncbi:hypothetical protein VKT23_010907 [Stygiomarasmius scandens]|uniref:Heterokaryon incompatibility domain-containing protein n=1 Tax=Marasmiellus scandens TaxID=2682957 RepID=A0ABR1JBC6_9AGAR
MMKETDYLSLSSNSTYELPLSTTVQFPKRSLTHRLCKEYPGVRGGGWFSRYEEQHHHVLGNTIRVISYILLAPFVVVFPIAFGIFMLMLGLPYMSDGDKDSGSSDDRLDVLLINSTIEFLEDNKEQGDYYDIPIAVLRNPPGYQKSAGPSFATYRTGLSQDLYAPTNFEPHWMLEVQVLDGKYAGFRQVVWNGDLRGNGYTAISYGIKSAHVLFEQAGKCTVDPKPEGKDYSFADRRRIAKHLLEEYYSAKRHFSKAHLELSKNRTEYIWIDEFCISDKKDDYEGIGFQIQRKEELARIPDIFRGAENVVVFCEKPKCEHVTLDCPWGKRLFTLGEILHAKHVERMTRMTEDDHHCFVYPESAQSFRERMLHEAALKERWHLHSLLMNSINSGSTTWQSVIHALIVETIRRDIDTGFTNHNLLGQGLNGLLPRRARPNHLLGKNGWADLAWLLEVNQGFYNAAALAAVCALNDETDSARDDSDDPSSAYGWLGPPLEPKAGNERLEPLVHAFPVGGKNSKGRDTIHLNIVGAEIISLEPCIRRNKDALYRLPEYKWKKIGSAVLLIVFWIVGFVINVSARLERKTAGVWGAIVLIYFSSIAYNLYHLSVGLRFIERKGWVFLGNDKMNDGSKGDAAWGAQPETALGRIDSRLGELIGWDNYQLAPKWNDFNPRFKVGHLVDLQSGMKAQVFVTKRPNAMAVLAVHGTGVTCMLLNRPEGASKVAEKVGMVNLPSYILAKAIKSGSIRVGL